MIRPILAYGNPILKQTSSKVDTKNDDIFLNWGYVGNNV